MTPLPIKCIRDVIPGIDSLFLRSSRTLSLLSSHAHDMPSSFTIHGPLIVDRNLFFSRFHLNRFERNIQP
jgi:hypothetical protein